MKYTLSLCILFLIITGCDKDLDFDGFNRKPEIIVQGHFTTDSVMKVSLALSDDIMQSGGSSRTITDAQVSVIDSAGRTFQLIHQGEGIYNSSLIPLAGMPYKLDIITADGKQVGSMDQIPADSIKASLDTLTGPVNRLDVKLMLNDPPGVENRYILRLLEFSTHYIYNGESEITDSISGWFPMPITSSNNIFEISNSIRGNALNFEMFEDEFFDGQDYTLNLLIDRNLLLKSDLKTASTKVQVYLKSVGEPCYSYYLGIIKNSRNYGGPFSTNFNPEDNIENGHGIFSGYRYFQRIIDLK